MRKKPLRIRKAISNDFRSIIALIENYEKNDVPFARRYYKRYFEDDPLLAKDQAFVSEIDGEIVGISGFYLDHFVTNYAFWLSWFVVAEQYRGRERGWVAAKMLSNVLRKLKRLKVGKVFVATLGSDGRAVRFYLKNSFEIEARLSDYYYRDEDQLILGRYL